jgi:hypothetical protein
MRDYDEYHDDGVRLHTPVLQRVLILAAVIITVPVVMWTITAFVRSYVARPKVPVVQHLASSESPNARVGSPAVIPAAPAADQGAPVPQRADAKPPPPAAASATAPAPPPANVSPPAVQPASIQPPAPAPSAPAPVPRRAAAGADIAPPAPAPAPPLRTADSAPAAGSTAGKPNGPVPLPRVRPVAAPTESPSLASPSGYDAGLSGH